VCGKAEDECRICRVTYCYTDRTAKWPALGFEHIEYVTIMELEVPSLLAAKGKK